MKNLKRTSVFILSFLIITVMSCNDEPLEGQFDTSGGGNGGGGSAASCVDATNNVADATAAFNAVTPADANYTAVCNDYSNALQDFLDVCGDSTGAIQALIDGLDCTAAPDDCPAAQAATDAAQTAYNADASNATLCNAYISALRNEIAICGDTTGALQDIIDGLDCTDTGAEDYWPRAIGNSWTLRATDGTEDTYTMTGVEMLDGFEFYAFDELYGSPSWLRKSGPNYYLRAEFSGEIPGYQLMSTPFTINMIKDDAAIGETWESNVNYTITYIPDAGLPSIPETNVDATYTFEMMERDISKIVEGETYNEVIHIEMVLTALGENIITQYYYANGIGIIEYNNDEGDTTLLDYNIN